MPALSIQPTFPIFTDIDGQPLESGYIWIGTTNLNPITNPITAYWDAALTLAAVQPIRTIGGYPVNNGTPARLYVNSDYSIQVQNRNGSVVYSAPAAGDRFSDVVVNGIDSSEVSFIQAGTGAVTRTAQAKMRDVIARSDFDSDLNFNAAAVGKVSINGTNKLAAPRFEGTATDDSGTPDAIFRVTRTHTSATSPHSFRDQTTFDPTSAGLAACSYDAAMTSSGSANKDHTIAFQSRNVHSGPGTLTTFWGFGSFNVAEGPVTNSYGSYVATLTGGGSVTNEYGFYCANLTKGANKYPIFVANNVGTNSIGAATNFNGSGVVSVGGTVKVFIGDAGNGYKSIAYNHNMQSNTYDYADQIQSMYFGPQDITFRTAPVGVAGATPSFVNILSIRTDAGNPSYRAVFPVVDNVSNLGVSGLRWKEIFCANGTINTSDARAKTEVRDLTAAELAAAKDLAKAVGGFKWLASVAEKGESARTHIGMTVQCAMEIMQSHGLDPLAYGFICYDKWDDEFVDHPAVYHQATNEAGEVVQGEIKDPAWREQTRKAGDSYGFRSDQLALFILRGLEARLSALEAL